jgi:peroxin-13
MGGYGGAYGGYGSGSGMGGGVIGLNLMPIDGQPLPLSLTQTLESPSQHKFALLHPIVQTFSSVAQMLDSTCMATHSSFLIHRQIGEISSGLASHIG